jgi:H+/Cl- antiporter ClcA
MSGQHFVLAYLQACAGGKLPISECGPVWQLLVIAMLLAVAVAALLVLRKRPKAQSS